MFGAAAHSHHQPHESQRSTPSRPSHNDHPASRSAAAPVDTPMSDAVPQHFNPSQTPSQPPPSPRFKPHSSQRTPTQLAAAPPAPRPAVVPSSSASSSAQASPRTSASPQRIKVKSLSHIQSFAADETSPFSQTRAARRARENPNEVGPQYEISEMPVSDIIEMVAGLLTKITTTNDRQHEHLHRQIPPPEGTSGLSQQTTSVLAFHGKNVPTISILSYLTRIHKYCPTTYEVFLSLLVYFDRMTEHCDPYNLSQFFVVDSFNIHRLVIAGVTCASKFFSDIFYTNSRYAKVGGLPLVELNHLELQFLLLNDFRLAVPLEEMEAYGTMLVEFYAREVVAQQQQRPQQSAP
ncbi:cyclin-dependent protein kinase complex component [Neofusicoccum parvum]|nr:cyclin-dependent protein kinase complex component [Neofusicoccum parvum]